MSRDDAVRALAEAWPDANLGVANAVVEALDRLPVEAKAVVARYLGASYGMDAAWANRTVVAHHLLRAGCFRREEPAVEFAGQLVLAAHTGERWDLDPDELTPEQRVLAARLAESKP